MYTRSKKPSKYRAVKTVVDGITFDSKKEARRYQVLKLMERGKEIVSLELQPEFKVYLCEKKMFTYKADFGYICLHTGDSIIEDVKGFKTPVYRLKKKIIEAVYGVKILET